MVVSSSATLAHPVVGIFKVSRLLTESFFLIAYETFHQNSQLVEVDDLAHQSVEPVYRVATRPLLGRYLSATS